MGHNVFAKSQKPWIHPVQDSCRLLFPMDDPLLSCCIALSSSFLCSLTLFIWVLPPNTWQPVAGPWSHHKHQPKATLQKAPKPLIPIQCTHFCTVFHTNYLPECFTRGGREDEGLSSRVLTRCRRETSRVCQGKLLQRAAAGQPAKVRWIETNATWTWGV